MVAMSDVIIKLAESTTQGRVPWKTSVGETQFSARFGQLLVLISSRSSGHVKLAVFNEKGTEIASAEHDEVAGMHTLEMLNPVLINLFRSAKRTALGTDQALTELIELIDGTPPIAPQETS